MPILRLLLAAAVAVAAIFAGLFAAVIVAATALVAYIVMMITGRGRKPSGRQAGANHASGRPSGPGDVIDVEADEVGSTPGRRPDR